MLLTSEPLFKRYPATAARAVSIAYPFRWESLSGNGHLIWGEYKVPNWQPFYTTVDVIEERFHCTCPSRENPCKHILALWILLLEKPESFDTRIDPPEWVLKALPQEAPPTKIEKNPEALLASAHRKEQTRSERIEWMRTGAPDLSNWLSDRMRQGLSPLVAGELETDAIATRLVDAKLGGLAKKLRRMTHPSGDIAGVESDLLSAIAELYIAVKSLDNLDVLPEGLQQEILAFCGVHTRKEELMQQPPVTGEWIVLGQREGEEEPNLRFRRVWLQEKASHQSALLLDYAFGGADFQEKWTTGKIALCTLRYYPAAVPLRAATTEAPQWHAFARTYSGLDSIAAWLKQYAAALSQNPLLQVFPACLKSVVPVLQKDKLWCVDRKGAALPVARRGIQDWKLLGISAGQPIDVFGEWDSRAFYPLSAWSTDRTLVL